MKRETPFSERIAQGLCLPFFGLPMVHRTLPWGVEYIGACCKTGILEQFNMKSNHFRDNMEI